MTVHLDYTVNIKINKVMINCVVYARIFLCISLYYTPYFCLYLNCTFADIGINGPYHVTYVANRLILGLFDTTHLVSIIIWT